MKSETIFSYYEKSISCVRGLRRMPAFQWKSPRERSDFAYFEEAFRDYPHSNENCSIADWLGCSSANSSLLFWKQRDTEEHEIYRVFCPLSPVFLGPPALYCSSFSCPWTLFEQKESFVSRATHPRVRTRSARFTLHQQIFPDSFLSRTYLQI